jgi:molybdenum cofactor cytidylyltransferase
MIAGILLAAGSGTRFGSDKRVHEVGGKPLIRFALQACVKSRLDRIHVVFGPDDKAVRKLIASCSSRPDRVHIVENTQPQLGMMSSLKAALATLPAGCDAAMIVHGDMPLVTPALMDRLIEAFESDGGIVVPQCEGRWQHPRVIPRRLFDEFLALKDDEKGLAVLERHEQQTTLVQAEDPNMFLDIDSIDDIGLLDKLLKQRNEH